GARLLARLDTGVVSHPPHALLPDDAPEPVVDRLQRAHQQRPGGDRAIVQRLNGHRPPPRVRLGEGADDRAGEAAAPVLMDVGPELVAREPVDLELLDTVVDAKPGRVALDFRSLAGHSVEEGDAVGGAGHGALVTNGAEIGYADVRGLPGNQRQV